MIDPILRRTGAGEESAGCLSLRGIDAAVEMRAAQLLSRMRCHASKPQNTSGPITSAVNGRWVGEIDNRSPARSMGGEPMTWM